MIDKRQYIPVRGVEYFKLNVQEKEELNKSLCSITSSSGSALHTRKI